MLDILILAALLLVFVAALMRWRSGSVAAGWATVLSGALLLGFVMWWYVLNVNVLG
ncbi:MAG TPA: hypothetical protein VKZ96_10195 [Thermomicrobiales bacterium]|nr:hypothetical protein [Thermomicrobiales bacterium]